MAKVQNGEEILPKVTTKRSHVRVKINDTNRFLDFSVQYALCLKNPDPKTGWHNFVKIRPL